MLRSCDFWEAAANGSLGDRLDGDTDRYLRETYTSLAAIGADSVARIVRSVLGRQWAAIGGDSMASLARTLEDAVAASIDRFDDLIARFAIERLKRDVP